jgi:hypothetical protein
MSDAVRGSARGAFDKLSTHRRPGLPHPIQGEPMNSKKTSIAALALCTLALSAAAQSPAAPAVPPNPCEKPTDYVPVEGTSDQMARVQKRMDAYHTCINDYVKGVSGKAKDLVAQAQAYQEAGNTAINTYNEYVQEMNKRIKSDGDKDKPSAPTTTGGSRY